MGLEFDIGISLFSEVDTDGFINIQYDAYGEQKSGVQAAETHHPLGLVARPLDPVVDASGTPDPTQAEQLLLMQEEGKTHVLCLEDPRSVFNLPPIQKGETCLYNCFASFVRLAADGTVTLFTTDNNSTNGNSVYRQASPTQFKDIAPWGMETFDYTGKHIVTKGGARFSLTGVGGVPAPFDALLSTVALLQAKTIALDGIVSLGGGAKQDALVMNQPLQALILLQNKLLKDLVSAVKALAMTPAATGVAPYGTPAVQLAVDLAGADLPPVLKPAVLATTQVTGS